jgi:hypothetical protein
MVFGAARVGFLDAKLGVDESQDVCCLTRIIDGPVPVSWDDSQEAGVASSDFEKDPPVDAMYEEVPAVAGKQKSYQGWTKDYVAFLYGSQKLDLLKSPSTGRVFETG